MNDVESSQADARAVIARLAMCLKVATVHQLSNAAVRPPMKALLDQINPRLVRGEMVLVQIVTENLYVNNEPVRLDQSTYESGETLRGLFERLGIQEISFSEPLTEDQLRDFLAVFQRYSSGAEPSQILEERLTGIGLRRLESVAERSTAASPAQRLIYAYAQFMSVLERTIRHIETGKDPRLSRLRRSLQILFDASNGQEELLLGITQLRRTAGGGTQHLTSVAALTLLLGRQMGLTRSILMEAGIAAALHDIAREKHGAGQAETVTDAAAQRAYDTVLKLSSWSGLPIMLRSAAVAYEHRLPPQGGGVEPTALARLIAVPCAYDLLRHPPPPRAGFPPPQAIEIVLGGAEKRYDSLVARFLGRLMGRYPPGTLVSLSNGVMAAVVGRPDPEDVSRVKIRLLPRGQPSPSDLVMDLGNPAQNKDGLSIIGVVDARASQVNPLECLFFQEELDPIAA